MHRSYTVLALVFYILLAIFVVIIARAILYDAEKVAIHDFISDRTALVNATVEGIQTLVNSTTGYMEYLSTLPEVQRMDIQKTRKRLADVFESLKTTIASITRTDSTGRIIVTIPYSEYEGSDIKYQSHIKKLLSTHNAVIGGPLRIVQGFDAIVIHIPTFVNDTIFTGSIAAVISFDSLKSKFLRGVSRKENEVLWLANARGEILYHTQLKYGRKLDEFYDGVADTAVLHFLADFPMRSAGKLSYKGRDGERRIICWQACNVGSELWMLAIDSDVNIALAPLLPLKWKLTGAAFLVLLAAFISVISIIRVSDKRAKIEQQNRYLSFLNTQRERLEAIYKFSQKLLSIDINTDITPDIVNTIKSIAEVPFAMVWNYDSQQEQFFPGESVIDDYRISEELRSSGIDIAQVPLNEIIDGTDLRRLSAHIAFPAKIFSDISPSWAVLVSVFQTIHSYTHIIVIPLGLRERLFACLIIPGKAEASTRAELIESFRLSVSQVIYIRSILTELITNDRIHRDILNTVDKAIYLIDSEFTILSASPAFYSLYEVRGEAIGRNLFDVVPFLRSLHTREVYREVMRTNSSRQTEETYISQGGQRRFTRTKIIPIAEEGELVRRLLTIVDDVTEYRLLEEKLKRTANELSQKNRQLQKLAITDELTKLRNYRYFIEQLPKSILQHRSKGKPMSLVSMDIDNFKHYNDNYGHPAGDRLLAEVADIIRGFLRSVDIGARYGGDEFCLILSETDLMEAQDVAERLCTRIAQAPFPGSQGTRTEHISASLGIAVLSDDVHDAEELMRRADAALYASKAHGKNRVTIYEPALENNTKPNKQPK